MSDLDKQQINDKAKLLKKVDKTSKRREKQISMKIKSDQEARLEKL